jgi:hypothetical protein
MSAGTVISGGFPGRVAQEVTPNPKCRGCLHYDGQAGRIGACTIGLRPWLCGDGEAQDVGYAPIGKGAGTYLHDLVNDVPQAHEVEAQVVGGLYGAGSTRPVTVQHVSLGEEHAHFVKSMVAEHVRVQKSQCRFCLNTGSHGTQPANVLPQSCSCQPIRAQDVAKALVTKLDNRQRVSMTLDDLTKFVRDVVKGGASNMLRTSADVERVTLAKSEAPHGGHLKKAEPHIQPVSGIEPQVAHFKSPHGRYKIESHADHSIVHYHPNEGRSSQHAVMRSHEHAVKMAKIHAFVNDHDTGVHHATLHEDHVKLHDHETGEKLKITSMKRAREHLGY